jgi:hypothetical protein
MMKIVLTLLFSGSLGSGPDVSSGSLALVAEQTICPAEQRTARRRVDVFLTHADFAEDQQRLGIHGLSPAQARVLNDSTDLAMCRRLVARFGPSDGHPNWQWTAYEMGSVYLVSWWYVRTDGGIRIGRTPWLIVDEQVNDLLRFAS